MKELKIEIDKDCIDDGDSLTEKKAYDVYWVDYDHDAFLIMDNDRDFMWIDFVYCKGAF